jgi:hypothetical protein
MADQSKYTNSKQLWAYGTTRKKSSPYENSKVIIQKGLSRRHPTKMAIMKWERKLFTAGGVLDRARSGRQFACGKACHEVEESLLRSPKKTLSKRSSEPEAPISVFDFPYGLLDDTFVIPNVFVE